MKTDPVIEGAIDLHIHSGPDCIPRWGDSIDIARLASEMGMRAVVFKDHFTPGGVKARLTEKAVPGIAIFGVFCLNHPNGGMNIRSVNMGIDQGAKVIMMPTMDSEHMVKDRNKGRLFQKFLYGQKPVGISIYNPGTHELREDLCKILELVAKYDLVLSNGHLSPEESIAVFKQAHAVGVKRLMVEHPNSSYKKFFQLEHMKELVALGAYLSLSFNACSPVYAARDPRDCVEIIKAMGAEHCTLITDGGQIDSPAPAEGLRVFCHMLIHLGVSRNDIEQMIKTNPAKILGLNLGG
ncbi:MAG: PHP domain-containing protein [Deltaproteobacteria bacterium]|nr:PHP domain-containing protein [Deltaproteobacteria bacterium]